MFFFFSSSIDILQHACQIYVMKYLSTIERVFKNDYHIEAEGDYQHDLMSVDFFPLK
jgi:hypothetical protein